MTNHKSILDSNKKQSLALLNTLNDLSEQKTERAVANVKSDNQIKSALEITFINDFYEAKNNLKELETLQSQMRETNLKEKMSDNSLETLPIRLIYFLVIRENFDLTELKRSKEVVLYTFDKEQLKQMKKESNKQSFLSEILNFKNVNLEDIQQQVAQDEDLARLERINLGLSHKEEDEDHEENIQSINDQLPEDVLEQLAIAEATDLDIEEKLKEMNYTEQEVEEIIEGYEY